MSVQVAEETIDARILRMLSHAPQSWFTFAEVADHLELHGPRRWKVHKALRRLVVAGLVRHGALHVDGHKGRPLHLHQIVSSP